MLILVDYDNVESADKRSLQSLIEKIHDTIGMANFSGERHSRVRLYGGWYENRVQTRMAQNLSAEIQRDFPRPLKLVNGSSEITIIVKVELAVSVEIDPRRTLFHTFRPRGRIRQISCHDPRQLGCADTDCPLVNIHNYIGRRNCEMPACSLADQDILFKAEQKLADTMIAADLIYHANASNSGLCVVSSDDDLWPGIVSAIYAGKKVIHVHTNKTQRQTPDFYSNGFSHSYSEIFLG